MYVLGGGGGTQRNLIPFRNSGDDNALHYFAKHPFTQYCNTRPPPVMTGHGYNHTVLRVCTSPPVAVESNARVASSATRVAYVH